MIDLTRRGFACFDLFEVALDSVGGEFSRLNHPRRAGNDLAGWQDVITNHGAGCGSADFKNLGGFFHGFPGAFGGFAVNWNVIFSA